MTKNSYMYGGVIP